MASTPIFLPVLGLFGPDGRNLQFWPQNCAYLRIQGPLEQNNVLHTHLTHGFGGNCGTTGPVTLENDGDMKFYRWSRGTGRLPARTGA